MIVIMIALANLWHPVGDTVEKVEYLPQMQEIPSDKWIQTKSLKFFSWTELMKLLHRQLSDPKQLYLIKFQF